MFRFLPKIYYRDCIYFFDNVLQLRKRLTDNVLQLRRRLTDNVLHTKGLDMLDQNR